MLAEFQFGLREVMPECFNRASSAVTDKRYQQGLWIPAFAGMTLLRGAVNQTGNWDREICYDAQRSSGGYFLRL